MYLDITELELEEIVEEIMIIMGSESIDVDLTKKEILVVMRRGLKEFEKETSIWQLKNQFGNVYGLPSGRILSNQLATFNLNLVNQITDWFASMARVGGKIPWRKDYITLEPGRQIYDMSKESSKPYVAGSRRIHRVMWYAKPEMFTLGKFTGGTDSASGDDVINSNQWNFTSSGLNYGNSPLNYLGYSFDTILLLQSMEQRRKLFFSEFFYNISGDILELLPMPGGKSSVSGVPSNTRVFYYYFEESDMLAGKNTSMYENVDGVLEVDESEITPQDASLIINPIQMKIEITPWSGLSEWAKNWIWEYTLARSKYIQAAKWRKVKKIFSSGEMEYDLEFDYNSLLDEAKEELRALKEDLRSDLEKLNLATLYEEKQQIVNAAKDINKNSGRLWFVG